MPAWDLVLRPVKDVAIVYALGDQRTSRAARDAHHAGVEAAVRYLDGQVGTRTGRDGAKHVAGSGLVAVGFTHRVSRGGDPLPHTHLVIVNRTQGPDGQWRTLDSRDLLAHRQAADAIYRAAYQTELTRTLGIRWAEPDRWGNRAIVGMPPELVKAFSKRHEQISAELERLEREEGKPRTAKLIQYAAHATRPAKTHDTPETLHGRWQQEAREHGHEPERLVAELTDRAERQPAVDRLAITRAFDQLASPDGLTANASTFARREALVALGGQLAAIHPAQLEDLTDRFLAERCLSVMADQTVGERRWTTPSCSGSNSGCWRRRSGGPLSRWGSAHRRWSATPWPPIPAWGSTRRRWSATCARAAPACRWWSGGPAPARPTRSAWPGTPGSWTATRSSAQRRPGSRRSAWTPRGSSTPAPWTGCWPSWTRNATLVAGVVARMGGCWRPGRCWWWMRLACSAPASSPGSSTTPSRPGQRWCWWATTVQLAAIEAGGGFRGLRLRLGASELTNNRRQQETWEREAVEDLRNGDLDVALGAYRAHGRLVAAETPGQLKQTLLADWWQAFQQGERVAILAYRREEVDQFNTACQQLRQQAGQLGPDRLQVGDRQFAVGDAVVCGKNALRTLGVANGSRGQVLALDPERRWYDRAAGQAAGHPGRPLPGPPPSWWTRGNPGRHTWDLGYAATRPPQPRRHPGPGAGPRRRQRGSRVVLCGRHPRRQTDHLL